MRVPFVSAVSEVLARDDSGMFITGDLGFNALEAILKTTYLPHK